MLRQLARLTRPLPAAGPEALTVAVYADGSDETIAARESGFEGVACVDDAARLLSLLCRVWERSPTDEVEAWARGLLEFVLWMQQPDGRWVNFVYDWDGSRNEGGLTSVAGGENFWHARAISSLSRAWLAFDDERAEEAMQRGLEHAVDSDAPSDVRAIHVETCLRLIGRAGREGLAPVVRDWAREIASCVQDGVLMNNPYEASPPHLWAHVQEGVLADVGAALDEPGLIEVAEQSAAEFLVPIVRGGFDLERVTAYDVSSVVFSLDRLGIGTGERTWSELATEARAWFDRRDAAGNSVYDRDRGRIADGVDEGRISENSGAESNLEAAGALLDDAIASAGEAVKLLPVSAG